MCMFGVVKDSSSEQCAQRGKDKLGRGGGEWSVPRRTPARGHQAVCVCLVVYFGTRGGVLSRSRTWGLLVEGKLLFVNPRWRVVLGGKSPLC